MNLRLILEISSFKEIFFSHFVDDTLVIWRVSTIIVEIFKLALDQFINVLGNHINKIKCHMYGWNISPQQVS